MNGAFHRSSDINRLYVKRAEGGRGLKNIKDMYECRTISLLEHFEEAGDTHGLLKLVREHEGQGIVRLGNESRERIKETAESSNVIEATKKIHNREWLKKVTHGYHQTQIESQDNIDTQKTNG